MIFGDLENKGTSSATLFQTPKSANYFAFSSRHVDRRKCRQLLQVRQSQVNYYIERPLLFTTLLPRAARGLSVTAETR